MAGAPSVRFPVGRPPFLGPLLVLGWLTGTLAIVLAGPGFAWQWSTAGVALLLSGALARRFWNRFPIGELTWDGQTWWWPSHPEACEAPVVRLDMQRHMLVQLPSVGADCSWIWLEASADPRAWPELRRALFARACAAPDRSPVRRHE
jgi:hypothetical protein